PLRVIAFEKRDDHVIEGILEAEGSDIWFPILDGVPSFLSAILQRDLSDFAKRHGLPYASGAPARAGAAEQARTNETFSDKWRRFKNYGLEPQHQDFLFGWYCKKFGLADRDALIEFYCNRKRVLEIGPGSGFNTRFIAEHCRGQVFALDI